MVWLEQVVLRVPLPGVQSRRLERIHRSKPLRVVRGVASVLLLLWLSRLYCDVVEEVVALEASVGRSTVWKNMSVLRVELAATR